MLNRRLFLSGAALAATGFGVAASARDPLRKLFGAPSFDTAVRYPGREAGHQFRDAATNKLSRSDFEQLPLLGKHDTLIVGSGAAALSCAWQLHKAGVSDFRMLEGPTPFGNAAFGQHLFSAYPQGAHYLPVPNTECMHVRHILQDLGVLLEGVSDEAPLYDERYLVHASAERVFHDGRWHTGLLPELRPGSPEARQWAHIQAEFRRLASLKDSTGLRMFQVPVARGGATTVGEVSALDRMTFAQWLQAQGVEHPLLRWYFDYCCKDEYGVEASLTSAWAGVHYFCIQHGKARNADENTVLTAPNGLGFLAQGLAQRIPSECRVSATAFAVRKGPGASQMVVLRDASGKMGVLQAQHVVIATPLFVARRLAPESFEGLEQERGLSSSPWMVANFFLERFPVEKPGEQLSWDNVVSGSPSLGYIVATHQSIRAALPEGTVFSAYHALGGSDNSAARKQWSQASPEELLKVATRDLDTAYGQDWRRWCRGAELTIHGHAMAVPRPGFLSEPVTLRAREVNSSQRGLSFAHSDLSGYSVFEEASYWGVEAAKKRLNT